MRIAARCNAKIVPFAGVGAEDNYRTIFDTKATVRFLRSNLLTSYLLDRFLAGFPMSRSKAYQQPTDDRGLPYEAPSTTLSVTTGPIRRELFVFGRPVSVANEVSHDKN